MTDEMSKAWFGRGLGLRLLDIRPLASGPSTSGPLISGHWTSGPWSQASSSNRGVSGSWFPRAASTSFSRLMTIFRIYSSHRAKCVHKQRRIYLYANGAAAYGPQILRNPNHQFSTFLVRQPIRFTGIIGRSLWPVGLHVMLLTTV